MKRRLIGFFFSSLWLAVALASTQEQHGSEKFQLQFLHFEGRMHDFVTYDFSGHNDGLLDVLVVSIDTDTDPPTRWLSLFYQKKGKGFSDRPDQAFKVPDKAGALAFGNFVHQAGAESAKQICFLASDGVYYYPLEHGRIADKPIKLLHTETFFEHPRPQTLPIWWRADDLDKNGLDDLVIPTSTGYKVYMQTEPGHFGKISYLDLPVQGYGETSLIEAVFLNVNRTLPRVLAVDIDGDGRKDLVSIQKQTLSYFFQNKDGTFPSKPRQVNSIALREKEQQDVIHIVLVQFQDINGDGKADLIVTEIGGTVGIFQSIQTKIWIYKGDGSGRFHNPDAVINVPGVSVDPEFIDLNGEGKLDLVCSLVSTDLAGVAIKHFLNLGIPITYYIFPYDKKLDNYPQSGYTFSWTVRVQIKDIEELGLASVPLVYFRADHCGCGKIDMVTLDPSGQLEIRRRHDTNSWDWNETYYKTKLEDRPKSLVMVDVNNDKRADIFLLYGGMLGVLLSK